MTANPWDKFFWNDWENDPALKLCGLAAQGLWMRVLCICAKADPKGYLVVAGRPLTPAAIASLVGKPEQEVETLLRELGSYEVFSTDRTGRIYNRRMVREVKKSRTAVENGKKGGNPTLSKQTANTPLVIQQDNLPVKPHKPLAISQVPTKKEDGALARFDDFWNVSPKKSGKGDAEKAWPKALKLADADTLIAAMKRYFVSQLGKDRTFTKTPAPWLNGKHWLDDGIAPAPPAPEVDIDPSWGSDGERLSAAIEPVNFNAYFATAKFDSGPPVRILLPKQYMKNMAERKFARQLRQCFGELVLEVAA